jgi:hypothetical protein
MLEFVSMLFVLFVGFGLYIFGTIAWLELNISLEWRQGLWLKWRYSGINHQKRLL